jgi:ribonuclease P protein component
MRRRQTFAVSRTSGTPVKHDQSPERICGVERDERFRRLQRLRSSEDFQRVRRGRQISGANLVVHFARRPAGGPTRIGFSVSKRVGGAVTRNLVKRRLREAIRHQLSMLSGGWDLVVTARPSAAGAGYPVLAAELDDLFSRAHMWIAHDSQDLST